MTIFVTQGSARAWVGASVVHVISASEKLVTIDNAAALQKRPPGGRVGRCPAVPVWWHT